MHKKASSDISQMFSIYTAIANTVLYNSTNLIITSI